ncbi:MAG: preprotein translocase subunit YajC [Eubacterium sp.]|nr:preprotein translocase subunit YajC [Eubacterium sp.]MBR3276624.1 preprotein translocase subunit YajC [Eubacterium sp.]
MLFALGFGNGASIAILVVVMVVLIYFMSVRPQSKERKRQEEMMSAMDVGDACVTNSGFYGVIIDISDDDVVVEFGNNKNCRIPMKKSCITEIEKPGQKAEPEKKK